MHIIDRKTYIDKLFDYKDKNIIKVLTGVRRCGKSTIFLLYINKLIKSGVKESNIIYVNLEDLLYRDIDTYEKLYDYICKKCTKKKEKYYILIDEVQNIKYFEKAIDSLFLKENVDIYITGSNALMLSSEIATLLSGRYIEINITPFSYKEYCDYMILLGKKEKISLIDFAKYGSLPFCISLDTEEEKRDYINAIYNTIVLKDIITRNNLKEPLLLKNLIEFLLDNIGNEISNNSIVNFLNSNNNKTNSHMIDNLLSAIVSTYFFDSIKRYDIKGKQYLKTQSKFYVSDLSFRYFILGNKFTDEGRILENIVYTELKKRGYNINIGKVDNKEIDFIIKKGSDIAYIQVADTLKDKKTFEREITPLLNIRDNYKKMIITNDKTFSNDEGGIKIVNIEDFLYEK